MLIKLERCSLKNVDALPFGELITQGKQTYIEINTLEDLQKLIDYSYTLDSDFGGVFFANVDGLYIATIKDFYLE